MEEKVCERIGRLKQKYPSIHKHYDISYDVETEIITNRKTKEKREVRKVKSLWWRVKNNMEINQTSGTYF